MFLSVIIPTLDEAQHITALLERLQSMESDSLRLEIIVSDGGSGDETASLARSLGAAVVDSARGRGAQLNAGARMATGEALWFLHADALPHRHSGRHLARILQNPALCGGNFRLRFGGTGHAAHIFARIARQQRRLGIYYGDSGIWVRREVFETLGGFANWPLFEDYDFARRLEKFAQLRGGRTDYAPWPVLASSRRFRETPLRVLVLWLTLQALFSLGVSPQRLAGFYQRSKM